MAKPEQQAVKAFLSANPDASEGELIAAIQEEKRAAQKETSTAAVRALLPKIKAEDREPLLTWFVDGQSDANVQAEAKQLGAALEGKDFDVIMLNVFQLAKAAIKSFNVQPPTIPPPPSQV